VGGAAKILVVDDEPHARSALSELLRDEGYDVESAGNGADACERVLSFHPDLVLSDVEMPCMSGLELAESIRERPDAPVVLLMSSRESPAGASDPCLLKPIALAELLTTIAYLLANRGG
jgi:CheY-like chemotaxis protein